jgi:hypothetical protein
MFKTGNAWCVDCRAYLMLFMSAIEGRVIRSFDMICSALRSAVISGAVSRIKGI